MSDPDTPLRELHARFCQATGRNLGFQFYIREWADWAKHFTAADLDATLAWIAKENQKREVRYRIRTELLRLIGDLAVFDSLKAEAELADKARAAKARAWIASPADKILASRSGTDPTPPETPAKRLSTEVVIEALRSAKQ